MQYYRKYDTEDFVGDEVLSHERLYPAHTFAAFFDHDSNADELTCTDAGMRHEIVIHYDVELRLYEAIRKVAFPLVLAYALI